jgi:16S rRNA (guanine527-N7)-methyltransferase
MESLHQSLKHYNISLPKKQTEQLDAYCQLLWEWNSRFNLTRHLTYDRFVSRDLVDSLAFSEFLRSKERVLDVGSGGGVPGIVLKIIRPDLNIELCDSTGKKALALSEIVNELNLDIAVHHAKVETILAACVTQKSKKFTHRNKTQNKNQPQTQDQLQTPKPEIIRFTTLTIRAVAKLAQLLRIFNPYWTLFDRLLLVKGPNWISERGEARHYNLMNKLALRALKTYPNITDSNLPESNSSEQNYTENQTETKTTTTNSVVLQICRKDDFEHLDKIIDDHKTILPKLEKQEKYKHHNKPYTPRKKT